MEGHIGNTPQAEADSQQAGFGPTESTAATSAEVFTSRTSQTHVDFDENDEPIYTTTYPNGARFIIDFAHRDENGFATKRYLVGQAPITTE